MLWLVVTTLLAGTGAGAGPLLLAGGNLKDDSLVWGRLVELARGSLGIITAANSDPAGSAEFYISLLLGHGAARVEWIPVRLDDPQVESSPLFLHYWVNLDIPLTRLFLIWWS